MIKPDDFTLEDLFDAYFECRKHKRSSLHHLAFEENLETNMMTLWHDLKSGRYQIGASVAFVVKHPKIREVWAADFRDRIVHHLVCRAIADYFYRRFIRDSYACIPERGTHYGLHRVSGFVRSISNNWTEPAYALKVDVANFFNSVDRDILLSIMRRHVEPGWCLELIEKIVNHDPRKNVILRSSPDLFAQVPVHKSLLRAQDRKGLPIGNLTSQFFANVYMNEIDQFVKHGLRAKHYGRYVDDMVLFHENSKVLNKWRYEIDTFLQDKLSLHLHPNKIWLNKVDKGIDFVGFMIKPGRTYMRTHSLNRCKQKIRAWEQQGSPLDKDFLINLSRSMNSYLGMLRQVNGYKARKSICSRVESLFLTADEGCTKVLTRL